MHQNQVEEQPIPLNMHQNQVVEQQHFIAIPLNRPFPLPAFIQPNAAPQQSTFPQRINQIQPPQPVPTRINPTDWRLFQQQQVQSIQRVQHQSGALAYKATLNNGQQLLMHDLKGNPNELVFQSGVSQKWKGIGEVQQAKSELDFLKINQKQSHEVLSVAVYKPQNVNVKQVQTSVKGLKPDGKINLENVKRLDTPMAQPKQITQTQQLSKPADTNIKLPKINQANAQMYGKVGGAVGGTVGSILTDVAIDGYDNLKVGKAVAIGAICMVPYVGIGFQTLMASVAIGGIATSDFLSSKEKWHEFGVMSAKIGASVVTCYGSIELGMAFGAFGGPAGVFAGGILGGLFGGILSNLAGRRIDKIVAKEPFKLQVSFELQNKSQIVDGYMINSGINPECTFSNLGGAAQSIILIAQTQNHIAWVLPNIMPTEDIIQENSNRGLILCEQTQSRYLGPDSTQHEITFIALGIKEANVDEGECLQLLHDNQLTIICSSEQIINL